MLILHLVITTLMELLAIFLAVKFIKQEIKRLSVNVDACYGSLFGALINIPSWKDMKPRLDGIEAHLKKDEEEVSEVVKKLDALLEKSPSVALQRMEANMNILREAVSRTADNMQDMSRILAAMQEVAADFDERLEKLRRETPEPLPSDDEAKHSRAIEEGIANLLQYQVGKGKES